MFPVCRTEPEPHQYMDLTPHVTPTDLQRWKDFVADLPPCHPFEGPWIAGGAIRHFLLDEDHQDIDYYFATADQAAATVQYLYDHGASIDRSRPEVVTLTYRKHTIQCVRQHYFGSAFMHLDAFDFTLCQTAWDGEHLWITNLAYHDLLHKRMNLVSKTPSQPLNSYLRVLKYAQQGFSPSHATMLQLIEAAKHEYGMNTDITYGSMEGLDLL